MPIVRTVRGDRRRMLCRFMGVHAHHGTAAVIAAVAVTLAASLAPAMNGASNQGTRMLAAACHRLEVPIVLPAAYEFDRGLGIGTWSGGTVGYSFNEDGAIYPTVTVAAICPTYP